MNQEDENWSWKRYLELEETFDEIPGRWHTGRAYPPLTGEEFELLLEAMRTCLLRYGKEGFEEDCDFFLCEDLMGSRSIAVVALKPAKVTITLVRDIQRVLIGINPLWCFSFNNLENDECLLWIYPDGVAIEIEEEKPELKCNKDIDLEQLLSLWRNDKRA